MRRLWLVFRLLWCFCPITWAQAVADPAPEPPARITVIATADFHGALEPKHAKIVDKREVGGIDIIAAYVEALRNTNPGGVVLLDAGDLYQGTLLSAASEGKAVIEFYNDLGYDTVAVGNHDFDFGPVGYHSTPECPEDDPLGVIKQRIAEARFPFLAANIYDRATGKQVDWTNLRSHVILERKGVRIGVIGLTAANTQLITHPANVRGLEFKPLLSSVRRVLPAVRAAEAKVVILVVHAGVEIDEDTGEVGGALIDLARGLEPGEVDLIVGGHTHQPFSAMINDIPVIQSYPRGVGFARADLVVDRTTGRVVPDQILLADNTFFFRTDRDGKPPRFAGRRIRPVARFVKKLELFKRSIAHLENIRLGRALVTLQPQRRWDSAVGNLVCDAIRASDRSIDVAMYNAGGLRTSIPKGEITFGRVYEVVPFDNNLVTVMLTGAQIRDILEHGLSGPYGVMEISGLQVEFDPDAKPGSRCKSIHDDSGNVLRDDQLYKVATNEFVLNGGDGYGTFARGTDVHNTHTLIREVVARYIKQKGTVGRVDEGRYRPCSDRRAPGTSD